MIASMILVVNVFHYLLSGVSALAAGSVWTWTWWAYGSTWWFWTSADDDGSPLWRRIFLASSFDILYIKIYNTYVLLTVRRINKK
jgi:hypothetical protein